MNTYSDSPSRYELKQNYPADGSDKQFNIIFINDGISAHIMQISDVEALTVFRYCNICHRQAFRIKDPNLQKLIEDKYKEYLVEAAQYKNTIGLLEYMVDMLTNISIAQCANAIKYAICYSNFEINENYNYESTDKSIEITQNYWRAKVDSYIEQDSKKIYSRINDATLVTQDLRGRIVLHLIGQIISQVIQKTMRFHAVYIAIDEGCQLLNYGIIGGLSNEMHRYNIAGETKINHFEYNKKKKRLFS
ncbi:MAG: hypothetical protein EZS28_017932 [Streblomastix strix]|uniref:Uncharacterized protein n=1 Tax=Streblomastix strix TaxID=222440 RepID=A0A5J4VVP8_9EUKA|nr:MAG: hypothetical protein EZS28_017932 [Streblomastix strix]